MSIGGFIAQTAQKGRPNPLDAIGKNLDKKMKDIGDKSPKRPELERKEPPSNAGVDGLRN